MIDWKMFWFVLLGWLISGYMGYKIGDARGYKDGYEIGYRYDCKDEIGVIYNQVEAQSKAIAFTDSALKKILHENDSLKRQEYYKKRFEDSLVIANQFSIDSVRYSKVARQYSDSLNKAVGGHVTNIIQADGKINRVCILLSKYRSLDECKDGFDIRQKLDEKLGHKKRGKHK